MENSHALRRATGLAVSCVALALLVVAALVGWEVRAHQARVVDDPVDPGGWKTLAYEGVEVDVPGDWNRLDMGDCEWQFERWAPPGTDPCDPGTVGVGFYNSATFDHVLKPGVVRRGVTEEGPSWAGYANAGELAVAASAPDRDTTERILGSAQ